MLDHRNKAVGDGSASVDVAVAVQQARLLVGILRRFDCHIAQLQFLNINHSSE